MGGRKWIDCGRGKTSLRSAGGEGSENKSSNVDTRIFWVLAAFQTACANVCVVTKLSEKATTYPNALLAFLIQNCSVVDPMGRPSKYASVK